MTNLMEQSKKCLSPVLARYFDLEIERASGCYLYDFSGKSYLDFACGIAVTSTGHCHPAVVEAIQKQAAQLIHTCIGIAYYEPYVTLAEKLGQILGEPLTSVFLCQSGSEAIEAAIKLAKYATKKPGIIAFQGGFHGRTLGALSLTTSKSKYRDAYEPLLSHTYFTPFPYCYRCSYDQKSEVCGFYCLKELEKLIAANAAEIAGIIIEPVLGEGGYIACPPGFLNHLKEICVKNQILLILDEVQTGFARTGSWFAFQKTGVVPDIIALAKGIASGMPLGACIASPSLMAKWSPGAHGSTYGGNPVSCAAAIATISVLEAQIQRISHLSEIAQKALSSIIDHPNIGDVRVEGLMIGIEFVQDKQSKTPAPDLMKNVLKSCLEQGLVILSCGLHDNVIRIIPPLIVTEAELQKGLNIFTGVVHATY